jgi:hypothetical protein
MFVATSPAGANQMPLTRISAPKHIPYIKVKALADAAQSALVKTCRVPVKDLFQLITRFEAAPTIKRGICFSNWSLGLGVAYADHIKSSRQGDI